jgi:general stress protein 26
MSELVALAESIVGASPYGVLITNGGSDPHARVVQHLSVGPDCEIWIGTSPRSRKAAEVAAVGRAVYLVEDRPSFAYVSLEGRAEVVADDHERQARWHDGLRTFFPGGPLGDDFVLLHLVPSRLELMSFAHRIHPPPYGLAAATAERGPDGWRDAAPTS